MVGHSRKGHKELDTTERPSTDTSSEISFKNLSQIKTFSKNNSLPSTYLPHWDLPGSPVAKTSPPNAGAAVSVPGWGAKIPHAPQPKKLKHK